MTTGDSLAELPVVVLPLHPPVLARVSRDGQWNVLATLASPTEATIRHAGDTLLVHDPAAGRIDILRITLAGVDLERTVSAPPATRIRDLAIDEARIFVGGSNETSAVLFFTAVDRDAPWTPLGLPESLAISGKAIDGLFVDADRNSLVALDDIVFPQAMLRFDSSHSDTTPRLTDEVELPGRTYAEHAPGIVANERWLAIRSTSVSEVGTAAWVDLLDRETLAPTARIWRSRHWGEAEMEIAYGGIGFVGTKLVVAGGEAGVGVLDTKGMRRRSRPFTWAAETRDVTKRVVWRAMKSGRAVDVVPVPRWGGALVIVETADGRATEWLSTHTSLR
jgi:hypothetical protein